MKVAKNMKFDNDYLTWENIQDKTMFDQYCHGSVLTEQLICSLNSYMFYGRIIVAPKQQTIVHFVIRKPNQKRSEEKIFTDFQRALDYYNSL